MFNFDVVDQGIHDCHLEMIEDDAFSNMKQLVRLDLSTNLFKTIGKRCFLPLIKLETIHLGNNQLLESIEKDIFSNMKFIKEIDLSQSVNLFSRYKRMSLQSLVMSLYL